MYLGCGNAVHIGDSILPSCMGINYFISHEIRILMNQSGLNGMSADGFEGCSFEMGGFDGRRPVPPAKFSTAACSENSNFSKGK